MQEVLLMLTLDVSNKSLFDIESQSYIILLHEHQEIPDQWQQVIDTCFSDIKHLLKQERFEGKKGSVLTLPVTKNGKLIHLIFVGLGKKNDAGKLDIEQYRRALGSAIRAARKHRIGSLVIPQLDASLFGISASTLAQQTATTLRIAAYAFDVYITDDARRPLDLTVVLSAPEHTDEIKKGVHNGLIIGHAVNTARYWIDLPPIALTPPELANKAREIADKHGLKITVYGEEKIKEMGMGGLAGVSSGSHQDCQLVAMEYDCGDKNAPLLAFVGKGITFDSGGLSLKPPAYMETMKEDMSGAAAVISSMQAIAQLKPKVNVVAVAALSENLPSGTALKPGDIIRFYNGKTAEVLNTDAEGRLVLADALSYAVKHYKPTAMIDLATLTGACAYALGPFYAGLMSEHDDLAHKVLEFANESGDFAWRLPLTDDYKAAIKTPVADIKNIGDKRINAGAITAGCFLQNFVGDTPWVHLDIAGTAFDVPNISYYTTGGTGYGVRLLTELAMHWQ
jgi:leucyl aminopeptidase